MTDGYEEDLAMYEASATTRQKHLDNKVLMRPISVLDYPKEPASVAPESQVGEAIAMMSKRRIGSLLVVEDSKVIGIFGERDVLIKGLIDGKSLDRPVKDYMTPNPACLTTHDPIASALSRMVVGGYRHIPLVNSAGEPQGILTMRDVMAYVVSFFPDDILTLPPHSEHNPPERNVEGG